MSLAAIDGILHYTPVFCDKGNVAASVSSQDFTSIEDPFKPEATTITEWLYGLCNNQFNLEEIEDGTAYETLRSR